MKKQLIIICVIIFIIGSGFFILNFFIGGKVKDFSIENYDEALQTFPSDEIVGEVSNSKMAIEKAEVLWLKLYGDTVKDEKPYKVYYDKKENIWLVTGSLHHGLWGNSLGGVAHVIFKKEDGKVLAVWHEK